MRLMFLALVFLIVAASRAAVVGKHIEYSADSVTLKGYIAYDDEFTGKRPGILVVHEWWGNNDYSRSRADMLAKLGYVAFAVDMYGNGEQADNPGKAGKLSGEISKDIPLMVARFTAALDELKKNETVDPTRIGAIGYCFGGGVVLNMACQGVDLKGVVSFHGSLASVSAGEKGDVKAKVLVCNGADDKFISADDIRKFKSEIKSAGGDLHFINYPGAIHSFTNPASTEAGKKFNIPLAYNEKADKKSWADMKEFFKKVLKN